MTREALRTWETMQETAGASADTRKARLSAVAAWSPRGAGARLGVGIAGGRRP
ncbi:hypothetical protein [Amycolatopsis sp. DSM 110486]|uniref:hypothetical protein n=1 Tax=Amycolatopsis sp. DSM 110486 TaxID=2865832 RepID=UPI001C69B52A|nr:hypothetical protein [Amycolatopsis sp. DSM 110486]QYN19033.1 hypothetical protein K1T34_41170 [Amycolatopsis sp. DSM 110486]